MCKKLHINYENGTKLCSKCQEWKSFSEFLATKDPRYKSGMLSCCRSCSNKKMKLYHENIRKSLPFLDTEQKEQMLEKRRKRLEKSKQWRLNNPDKYKNKKLLRNYGIGIDEYNGFLESQNNVCAICKRPETSCDYRTQKIRALAVDHDHETGKVRGLLCGDCNKGLGCFKDNIKLVEEAKKYLEIAQYKKNNHED